MAINLTTISAPALSGVTNTLGEGFWHNLFFRDNPNHPDGFIADGLFMFLWWLGVVWFVLLMGLATYWLIKYRRRPGVPAQRSASHNTPLEIAWTVIPTLILVVIFVWGFRGYMRFHIAESGGEEITLVANMWNWDLTYPNGQKSNLLTEEDLGADKRPVFVVPVDTPISLRMTSQDVIHSFWVPDFRVKLDVFPNRYSTYWFRATEVGDHWIFCAEYCGDQHSEMAAILRVVEPADYAQFLVDGGQDFATIPPAQAGQILSSSKGCVACHASTEAAGTGPGWAGTYGYEVRFTDGTSQIRDANYIRESILTPSVHIVEGYGNNMTPYAGVLTEDEINYLIAYIQSLSDKAPKSVFEVPGEGDGESGEGSETEDVEVDDMTQAETAEDTIAQTETAEIPGG
ncbi:MAG: cytochrome c oxidase subunit II [Planctomycetota bacterium]